MIRKKEFVLQNLGNEYILVPTGGEVTNLNGILVLNETALFIWKMLENEIGEKDLVVAVAKEYNVDEDRAAKDVKDFLEELSSKKMLIT
ncbi:MAG: PqqD family protein [Ignavibacteria bacterium]